MAVGQLPLPTRVVPKSIRIRERQPYGDLTSLIRAAETELAEGRLDNAMTAFQATLASWLRHRWVEHCGRPRSDTFDAHQLIRKLQSGLALDRWMVAQLDLALKRPPIVDRRHVDLVAVLVRTLTLEPMSAAGGEPCRS